MALLNPDHLLDQALRLITPPGGGAPRQADLRRAISNAYYAVFHAVVTEAADDLIGRTHRTQPRYTMVYRSIDHRSLRSLCELVERIDKSGKKNPKKLEVSSRYLPYVPKGGFGPDLLALAAAVVELQEKRHLADYDPSYRVSTSDAKAAVATSQDALSRLRNAGRTARRVFLALLIFSPR